MLCDILSSMKFKRISTVVVVLVFLIFLLGKARSVYRDAVPRFDTLAYISLLHGGSWESFREAVQSCPAAFPEAPVKCDDPGITGAYPEIEKYPRQEFTALLHFFTVKPLYLWTATALKSVFRLADYQALRVIAAGSYLVLGVLIALWLREHLAAALACLLTALIISAPFVLQLDDALLPDGLSTTLLLLAVYLVQYKATSLPPRLLLLLVLPLARADNIIFTGVYGLCLIYRAVPSRNGLIKTAGGFLAVCFLLNTLLAKLTHALPFSSLFYEAFVAVTRPSVALSFHLTPLFYAHTVLSYSYVTLATILPVPLIFAALVLFNKNASSSLQDLVAASTLVLAVRLALFPSPQERFYAWYALVAVICAATTLGRQGREPIPKPLPV